MEVVGLIGSKVLDTLLGELLKTIIDSMDKAKQYKKILERMQSNLKSIVPKISEIREYEQALGRMNDQDYKHIEGILEEGKRLVQKCAEEVRWWNRFYTKPKYAGDLLKWEEKLRNFTQLILPFYCLARMMEMHARLNASNGMTGSSSIPEEPTFVVGLERNLIELKMRLLQDPICILSAPGGCGKTTLAKKICHDEGIKSRFRDNIFFIYVSSTPNLMVLIQQIFHRRGRPDPKFQNEADAVSQLWNLLRSIRSPILLILDDVWSGSEDLVDRFRMQIPDYKILVTSRSALPRFKSTYSLTGLNEDDGRKLFLKAAASEDVDFCIPDELVNKIIKSCKGWPLALKVVGRSLCGQPEAVWIERWRDLSNGCSIFDSANEILTCLKSSFDVLNSRMKDCFMDLGAFPEDQKIPAPLLIDLWAGLYDRDGGGRLYEKIEGDILAMCNIYDLCHRNLASLSITREMKTEVDNCYHGHYVMQHDLLRELAIHQSNLKAVEARQRLLINISRDKFPDWWREKRHHHIKAHLLSISTDETFSSDWPSLQAPNVKVLVLNFWTNSYTLPEFIDKMEETKVLLATNYGYSRSVLNNFLVLASLPALERIRLEKVSISFPSNSSLQFQALQKITLVMCRMDKEFKNFHISNAFPNLAEISIDSCSDLEHLPPSLCNIIALRKLRITNCHGLKELPEEIGNLSNLEELRLRACTNLEMLPGSFGSLQKLSFLDISDCQSIWEMPDSIGKLQSLRKLYMTKCLRLKKLPHSTMDLKDLKVICDGERVALWNPFRERIVNLSIEIHKEIHTLRWLN